MVNLVLILAAMLVSVSAQADTSIYRCVDDAGTIVFSDRPCDAEARTYKSTPSLSVISAPDNVAARVEANRAFIEQRRERMREARRQVDQAEPPASVPAAARPQAQFVPYWIPSSQRPSPPYRPVSPAPVDGEREERFSALSGRQPGSARRRDQ